MVNCCAADAVSNRSVLGVANKTGCHSVIDLIP